jgi:hypothetical protein
MLFCEVGDHLGLEPGIGGSGGELLVVDVEVFFDVLILGQGSGFVFLDVLEVLEDVGEEFVVGFVPVGEGDAVGSVFEVVGHAVVVLVEADLGPVTELVDEDPVVDAGFELAALVFEGGVGSGDAVEGGLLLRGELLPEWGGEGVGLGVVVAPGFDVLQDEFGRGNGAGGSGGCELGGKGVAESGELERDGVGGEVGLGVEGRGGEGEDRDDGQEPLHSLVVCFVSRYSGVWRMEKDFLGKGNGEEALANGFGRLRVSMRGEKDD